MTIASLRANLEGLSDLFKVADFSGQLGSDEGFIPQSIAFEFANADAALQAADAPPAEILEDGARRAKLDYARLVTSSLSELFGVRLATALDKVYVDKRLAFELAVAPKLLARVDTGDLHELLGNTLDNAAKWADRRVRLTATRQGTTLALDVEDDGPGFPAAPERLLERGVRADNRVPGQGLGLAAVAEILRAYEGEIRLERSGGLGGARVAIRIPSA